MAKVNSASLLNHTAGTIGDLVVRQQGEQTIVQLRGRSTRKKRSADQRDQQRRFQQATAYAARILADPLMRAHYQKLGAGRRQPPNTVLISNFLTPPTVEVVDASKYHGRIGDVIRVLATDDVEVVAVGISIRDAAGKLLESGSARKDHGVWFYNATKAAAAGQLVTIEASAKDRPGHAATKAIPIMITS